MRQFRGFVIPFSSSILRWPTSEHLRVFFFWPNPFPLSGVLEVTLVFTLYKAFPTKKVLVIFSEELFLVVFFVGLESSWVDAHLWTRRQLGDENTKTRVTGISAFRFF